MRRSNDETLVGVFPDRAEAEQAVRDLESAGFRQDQVGFAIRHAAEGDPLMQTDTRTHHEKARDATSGALTGALAGSILGAAAALLIPGFGPILAGGLLASGLAGAAVGATAGSLIGTMASAGVPVERAQYYDREFQAGRALVIVKTEGRWEEAWEIMARHGATDDVSDPALGSDHPDGALHEREARLTAHTGAVGIGAHTVEPAHSEVAEPLVNRDEPAHLQGNPVGPGDPNPMNDARPH